MNRKLTIITAGFFTFLLVSLIWRSIAFAPTQLYDWDESIYARVAWEMVDNKTLAMTYNGEPWLEKPPLVIYLLAGITGLFGTSEVALRSTGVLFSLALAGALFVLTRKQLIESPKTTHYSLSALETTLLSLIPVAFLFSAPVFIDRTTMVNYDVPLALGWVLFFAVTTFPMRLLAICIGVMSKSLLGFYPLLLDLFIPDKKKLSWPSLKAYLFLFSLPLLWHIIALVIYQDAFIQQHLLDHLVRRVTAPIELHFGGRMYYFRELFNHYGLFIFLPAVSFGLILFDGIHHIYKNRSIPPRHLLVYLSPLGYIAFLTFSQTKIWWYIIPALPFLGLSLVHLAARVKNKLFRFTLIFIVFSFFSYQFVTRIYLDHPQRSVSEKNNIAGCLADKKAETIGFLVDREERKTKNVMEAAQIQISTSFIYGGSPGFTYYSKAYPRFYYSEEEFKKDLKKYQYLVLERNDVNLIDSNNLKPVCKTDNWFGFENKL